MIRVRKLFGLDFLDQNKPEKDKQVLNKVFKMPKTTKNSSKIQKKTYIKQPREAVQNENYAKRLENYDSVSFRTTFIPSDDNFLHKIQFQYTNYIIRSLYDHKL